MIGIINTQRIATSGMIATINLLENTHGTQSNG